MDEELLLEEMKNSLETNGVIRITSEEKEITIESIDDKEGYSYVSSSNKQFEDSMDAIDWAVLQFDGVENIEEWE